MDLILITSIFIRLVAMAWSLMLLHRLRDWRMGFLSAMLALMALRQTLTELTSGDREDVSIVAQSSELPGLLVSVLAFLAVLFLGQIIIERREKDEALRTSEELLRHSQKMEAIGRLAGGIAHDFNNILTAILGYSEALMRSLEPGSESHEAAAEIHEAGERGARLTSQLLAFSRKQTLHPQVLDLNQVVSKLRSMLDRLIGDDVELVVRPDPRAGSVYADSTQIEQVIMNLAVNAREAMPDGGTLEIAIQRADPSEGRVPGLPDGVTRSFVCLRVRDTGVGMNLQTREHIFDPFYTTKTRAGGTGLGLSTVLGIVEQSGGFVGVQSALGQGSTFSVFLPESVEPVSLPEATERREAATEPAHRTWTVLLVDDERSVRNLGVTVLRAQGHRVLTAGDGAEALEVAGRHDGRIDVLLTDLVMPGMTGLELADRLSRERPGIAVVYMSGYVKQSGDEGAEVPDDALLLAKPFTIDDMLEAVESAGSKAADDRVTASKSAWPR